MNLDSMASIIPQAAMKPNKANDETQNLEFHLFVNVPNGLVLVKKHYLETLENVHQDWTSRKIRLKEERKKMHFNNMSEKEAQI